MANFSTIALQHGFAFPNIYAFIFGTFLFNVFVTLHLGKLCDLPAQHNPIKENVTDPFLELVWQSIDPSKY